MALNSEFHELVFPLISRFAPRRNVFSFGVVHWAPCLTVAPRGLSTNLQIHDKSPRHMFNLATTESQPMVLPSSKRRPTFLWQAILITLPVAVLAAVGLVSLRQDKLLAEQEAREQAQAIAWPLARECGMRLGAEISQFAEVSARQQESIALTAGTLQRPPGEGTSDTNLKDQAAVVRWQQLHPEIQLSALPQTRCYVRDGILFYPADYSRVPQPPAWLAELPTQSAAQWREAEAALDQRHDAVAARAVLEGLIRNQDRSDDPLRANARLKLLLTDPGESGAPDTFRNWSDLILQYPRVTTESGLPLSSVACYQAVRVAPAGKAFEELLDLLVFQIQNAPSILTGTILEEMARRAKTEGHYAQERLQAIRDVWAAQERARDLLRHLTQTQLAKPSLRPLSSDSGKFIAFSHPSASITTNSFPAATNVSTTVDSILLLVPRPLIELAFREAIQTGHVRPPDYAAAHLWLGSDQAQFVHPSSRRTGVTNQTTQTLATVVDGVSSGAAGGYYPFTLKLELADPELLFARHRQRVWLFGAIIILAASTALVGLLASWRSFDRQQRLAEMKTNFVSSVSHELRAPIASVRLLAESLDRGKIPDAGRQAEYFRLIVHECRRLTSLIENVLDFSRIDQGRKQYEFEPTDLASLVEQTVRLMEPCATERQVTLRTDLEHLQFSPLDAQPEMDGRAIQQALVNLLDNAIKHSPAGKSVTVGIDQSRAGVPPALNVKERPHGEPTPDPSQVGVSFARRHAALPFRDGSTDGSSIRVWVEDSGEGIPPEEHGKIFEPFYRRGTELRRETQGIGIGLTIVKHIVEAHRGRVLVRSAVGQGSRFTIELPLNQTRS